MGPIFFDTTLNNSKKILNSFIVMLNALKFQTLLFLFLNKMFKSGLEFTKCMSE